MIRKNFYFLSANRITDSHVFKSFFAKADKIAYKSLRALYQLNNLSDARLGMIISKRYVPLAVDRNTIRRVIRESFRHEKEMLKGLDIIVLMRSECTALSKQALRSDVNHVWQLIIKQRYRQHV